jgi:hypothetical protein
MTQINSAKAHRFYAIPRTGIGRWGGGLIVGSFVVLILIPVFISLMNRTVVDEGTAIGLGIGNVAYLSGIMAGIVLSWVAIFAKKDRSIVLIIVASLFTTLAVFFGVGEFLLPH